MSFFGVPLSGLIASQDQLQSISSNLANLDTDGYKDQNDTFADIFAQSGSSNGAQDPLQTGLGASLAETTSNFTDGSVNATGISSNMALTGNGFFISKQTDGSTAYIRAGDFTTNSSGYLVDPDGGQILGYPAVGGVVNTASVLTPLQIGSGSVSPATASTSFETQTNLSSESPAGTVFNATPITLFDSLGNSHTLAMQLTKAATPANTWAYSLNVPTADTGATSTQVSSGSLTFNSAGQLVSVTDSAGNVTTPPPASITGIAVPLSDGAANLSLNWNLTGTQATVSQTNVTSATTYASANGTTAGTLSGYSIGSDGTIEGAFSNGTTSALGQVAIANFVNTQGLQRTGANDYQPTAGSGPALVGTAGTGGRGTITGGSVEGSNVDTATEFAKLIVAQQDYQANAKTVTTFDQVSQATIAMITA